MDTKYGWQYNRKISEETIMAKILIADDEKNIRIILSKTMENKGLDVTRASNGMEALDALKNHPFDLAILDIRMPEMSGLEILNHKNDFFQETPVIIITAEDTMEHTIEAMKRGAYDYINKPFDIDELCLVVDRALETKELKEEVKKLKNNQKTEIIGQSKAVKNLYKTIGKVANKDITILIQAESGCGKELVAKAIHEQGLRSDKNFVAVNCAAIPANLLESELFGSKKGAFTGSESDKKGYFEQANGGTLFLDEIGEMPYELQSKLLRVLQEKKIQRLGDQNLTDIDVRIIAATNQNLALEVQKNKFREDLFFRLNVVGITLPPLRERKEDIPLLVDYFLDQAQFDFNGYTKKLSDEALAYLKEKDWPGNIRQLENTIKRSYVLTNEKLLEVRHFESLEEGLEKLPLTFENQESLEKIISAQIQSYFEKRSVDDLKGLYDIFLPLIERPLITFSLRKCKGKQIKAAEILGINRNTLRKKISDLEIDRRRG